MKNYQRNIKRERGCEFETGNYKKQTETERGRNGEKRQKKIIILNY